MSRPYAPRPILYLSGFFLCLLHATASHAATLVIEPAYVQSFDSSMTPLGALANQGAATPLGGYVHVEFRMTLNGAAVAEDFWTAIFNVQLGSGLADASGWLDPGTAQASGFYPASPGLSHYDSNGLAAGGIQPHWQFGNADFGDNSNDLLGIIVEADSDEARNRQYGELTRPGLGATDALGYPTLIGALLLERTSLHDASVTVSPIAGSAWGTYTDNQSGAGDFTSQPATTFAGGTLVVHVPEPATLVQATLGLLGVSAAAWWRKRRPVPRSSR